MTAVMSRVDVVYYASSRSFLQSQRYTVRVVDRIGGGDSFAAGLIHGFVSGRDLDSTLNCVVAASALKQSFQGISTKCRLRKLRGSVPETPAGANRDNKAGGPEGRVCLGEGVVS